MFSEIIGAFTGQNKRDRHKLAGETFLLGLVGGAVTALLLAPKTGKETRRIIADKTQDAAGQVKDATVHAAGKVGNTVQNTAATVSKKVKRFHRGAKAYEREARDAARKLRHGARRAEREEADLD